MGWHGWFSACMEMGIQSGTLLVLIGNECQEGMGYRIEKGIRDGDTGGHGNEYWHGKQLVVGQGSQGNRQHRREGCSNLYQPQGCA